MAGQMLFVFDFDDTLVEGLSDTWVLQTAPDLAALDITKLYDQYGCWCKMMNDLMQLIHERGHGREDVLTCMKKMKVNEGMTEFIRKIEKVQQVDVIIVSDGNTEFISAVLEVAGCRGAIKKVYANPARFDETGRLRIDRYCLHDCPSCKKGAVTCKRKMLSDISLSKYNRIVYIGDGRNDVCPCLDLLTSSKDFFIVAREGYPLAKFMQQLPASSTSNPPPQDQELKPRQLHVVDFNATAEVESLLTSLANMNPS